jgi:hypothetical protein
MIRKINDGLALLVTNAVSTMWCAYLFAAFAIYGAPQGIHTLGFVNWFAEEFLQLVLLSVIMVGQKVQAERTIQLHATIKEHHSLLKSLEGKINASHAQGPQDEKVHGTGIRQEERRSSILRNREQATRTRNQEV